MAAIVPFNVTGNIDALLWAKDKENERSKKRMFPVTRYHAILNRPKLITEETSIAAEPMADFHLAVLSMQEVDDDTIFNMFKQVW